jgi:hypothetical protein
MTQQDLNLERPTGVVVIAIISFISGVLGVIGGMRGLGLLGPLGLRPGGPMVLPVVFIGSTMLVLSLILIALGVALIQLRPWAWTGAVTIAAVRLVTDFFFFFSGGMGLGMPGVAIGAAGMLANLIILVYLLRGSTKEVFGKE